MKNWKIQKFKKSSKNQKILKKLKNWTIKKKLNKWKNWKNRKIGRSSSSKFKTRNFTPRSTSSKFQKIVEVIKETFQENRDHWWGNAVTRRWRRCSMSWAWENDGKPPRKETERHEATNCWTYSGREDDEFNKPERSWTSGARRRRKTIACPTTRRSLQQRDRALPLRRHRSKPNWLGKVNPLLRRTAWGTSSRMQNGRVQKRRSGSRGTPAIHETTSLNGESVRIDGGSRAAKVKTVVRVKHLWWWASEQLHTDCDEMVCSVLHQEFRRDQCWENDPERLSWPFSPFERRCGHFMAVSTHITNSTVPDCRVRMPRRRNTSTAQS